MPDDNDHSIFIILFKTFCFSFKRNFVTFRKNIPDMYLSKLKNCSNMKPDKLDATKRYGHLYKILSRAKRGYDLHLDTHLSSMNKHKFQKQIINEALPRPVGVTTILKQSKPKSAVYALKKWEKNEIKSRGVEGFKKYQTSMLSTGTNVHTEIENALLENRGINTDHSSYAESIVRSGHFDLIDKDADLFVERKHVHPFFAYNGVVDLECMINGKRTIIDWKTSQTKKTADQLFDDPLQIAAYAYMVESCYPDRRIEQGAIVKMYKDGSPADMFVLTRKKLERTFSTFCERYLTFIALKMLNDENDRVVREYYGDEEGFEWLTMKKDEKN